MRTWNFIGYVGLDTAPNVVTVISEAEAEETYKRLKAEGYRAMRLKNRAHRDIWLAVERRDFDAR